MRKGQTLEAVGWRSNLQMNRVGTKHTPFLGDSLVIVTIHFKLIVQKFGPLFWPL